MARIRNGPREYWPSWRYAPDGSGQLFYRAEDIPEGWARKPGAIIERVAPTPTQILNEDELIAELKARNIDIKPTWGHAHMKRILGGDVSPTW